MSLRRLATIGGLLSFAATDLRAQVVERPVPFDSAGQLVVVTPYIADRASLRAPWWPVSGDFTEARLYTVNDSTYVLSVGRKTGSSSATRSRRLIGKRFAPSFHDCHAT